MVISLDLTLIIVVTKRDEWVSYVKMYSLET